MAAQNNSNGLLRVVIAAVIHGYSVLPCGPNKRPLVEWASLQTTRATIEQVERWHADLHPVSWGVVTGAISGIVVIDFDGTVGLATAAKYGAQLYVRTPNGGGHQYLRYPGFHVPTLTGSTKVALKEALPGADVRGDGGYACFAGENESGAYKRLRRLSEPDPWEGPLVDVLMGIINPPKSAMGQQRPFNGTASERVSADELLTTYLEKERNGAARNDNGLQLSLQLRDNGFSRNEAESVLLRYARAVKRVNTKGRLEVYSDAEALATVRSAYSRPPREPWASRRSDRTADSPPPPAENAAAKEDARQAGCLITGSFAEVQMKAVNWLWRNRIARGKVNLVAGNPGLGKSQLMASIAAVVSTGGCWPVDRTQCISGNVLFLSAEDDPADTLAPRLQAAGANLARVHFVRSVLAGFSGEGREVHRAFCLGRDLEALARALKDIGDVAAVVLDPISAYLGQVDSHINAEVRALLAPLSELAGQSEAAMIAVSHLNKSAGTDALLRISGSLGFIAAARAGYLVAQDPEHKSRRLFLPLKNNLAADCGGLAFRIEGISIKSPHGDIHTSHLRWDPEPVETTANEVIQAQAPEDGSALREAFDWLQQLLQTPTPAAEVFRQARTVGITPKTLRRAAERLDIRKEKAGMQDGWIWSLSGQPRRCPSQNTKVPEDAEDAHEDGLGTFGSDGTVEIEI
jgi:hypothetical protein